MYDDLTFPNRPLVAFLLAKLFFYLNDYDEALKYALKSDKYFDFRTAKDEFTEILVNKCIERYIQSCRGPKNEEHDNFRTIVNYVVESSISSGEYKTPLGVAIDTKDTNLFARVLGIAQFIEFL